MVKFPLKKLILVGVIMLPIILLAVYTVATNRSNGKKKTITEGTIVNRLPSEIIDEIAQAIEEEDFETAFVKIEENLKDPNIPTSRGVPLLVIAAQKDSYDLAAILLAKGSDANQPDANTGETALIKAARNGNINLMNLLLIANADPNATSRRGVTVLTAAIQNGNPQLTEFLLARGARAGSTEENLINYAFQKKSVGVDAMLKTGVNPNAADKNGNTALIIAASYGDMASAVALVTYKANVNAANNDGMTPLLYAIQTRNKEMTDFLIEKGADVNKANNRGEGPLFWAAYFGDRQLVENLLKLGADYDKKSIENLTAYQIAERRKHTEVAKLIRSFKAYKEIPRDEKGRPIVPKKQPANPAQPAQGAAAQSAPKKGAQPAAGQSAAANAAGNIQLPPGVSGMPQIPGMPAEAQQQYQQYYQQQQQQQQQQPRKVGNTEVGTLRTSSL